ncbi:MAG: dihydropteroate synthase [bacterium]|nr:dihydropteroate synthase [bacterium]
MAERDESSNGLSGDCWLWRCGGRQFDLARRVLVMGIVNVTPDSFSDGGRFAGVEPAVAHGRQLAAEGADILDVGGESTRPGAAPVSVEEELARVIPVIERLRAAAVGVPISIDTMKAEVARRAVAAGAAIINDIAALRADPAMAEVAAQSGVGLVLMHMQGEPRTMQAAPHYDDVVGEIRAFLQERLAAAVAAGIDRRAVVLDPGIGFGKTIQHNLEIFRRMAELAALPRPLLIGPSRKAFIGKLLDLPVDQRVEGTAAAVAAAIAAGVRVVRVHDVREMTRVVKVAAALAPWNTGP